MLHGDAAVESVEAVPFDIHRVEFDVHVVEYAKVAQGSVGARDASLVVREVFEDHDGTGEGLGFHLGLVEIIEIQVVGALSLSHFLNQHGRIRGMVM